MVSPDHKDSIRQRVWPKLREVARPDSRFHYDFSSFIADFEGSERATRKLRQFPCYRDAKTVFITPDNCLQSLRTQALEDGKIVLVTTYAMRRGFWLLDPRVIDTHQGRSLAGLLDGMETVGELITLARMKKQMIQVDLMVTGTGAINLAGVRFGKGHGFFDLEWAILSSIGVVNSSVPCTAVVHDCQVLDEQLHPEVFDTACDLIATPTRFIEVRNVIKPTCGILWDRLQPGMIEDIPPLQELQELSGRSERRCAQSVEGISQFGSRNRCEKNASVKTLSAENA